MGSTLHSFCTKHSRTKEGKFRILKMMLKAPILILVLLQVLNLNAAPTDDDYYYDEYDYDLEDTEFGSENICQLPKELGYSGVGVPLVDCDTLDKLEKPPCNIYSWGGSHPKICCPVAKYLNQPGGEEEECEGCEDYTCAPSELNGDPDKCPAESQCVAISKCGKQEFLKDAPPTTCGYTEAGEDMVCCSDLGDQVKTPQDPQYFQFNGKPYPCTDHSWKCYNWQKNDPDSCKPGHPSYIFMRAACPLSCKRCSTLGCVDNYAKCPEWSMSGACGMNPEFMAFNCRESCGACGFKSANLASTPQENKDGKEQYSYIRGFGFDEDGKKDTNYRKFSCGKYKELTGFEVKLRKKLDTEKIRGGGCSSIVISDRFVVTAAHCVPNELKSGETRQISIRDGTEFHESLEVRRLWRDNRFDPNSKEKYFDIAILELERRVIYDYEKYGDSPTCLGEENDLDQQIGLVQGFGITEDGTAPDNVLEANVTIISNSKCTSEMDKMNKLYKDERDNALPNGLSDKLLCTQGIWNKKKSVFTGPCDGDDGGPLFINSRVDPNGDIVDRTLVAINSGSLGKCGKDNFPAWWTRIASYVDWLKCIQVMAAETEYNNSVGDKLDLTHKQIEEACQGKLPV